jgi:hypothetical protein
MNQQELDEIRCKYPFAQHLLDKGPLRVMIAATGAGSGIQDKLWMVPGISTILYDAAFPYHRDAQDDFLRFTEPGSYCTPARAVALAMECYYRAFKFGEAPAIGIGVSANVATTEVHRGDHRVFAAWFSEKGSGLHSVLLHKGEGVEARAIDGELVDFIGLNILSEAVGLPSLSFDVSQAVERYALSNAVDLCREVFFRHSFFDEDDQRYNQSAAHEAKIIFPGAFNPPHQGHFGMALEVYDQYQVYPTFHITEQQPHKPALSVANMLQRAKMLQGYPRVFTENQPLYLDKAKAHPNAAILIGADAMGRLLDPKWGPDLQTLKDTFSVQGTTFLVFPRKVDGQVVTFNDLNTPSYIRARAMSGSWDVSSTELRGELTKVTGA